MKLSTKGRYAVTAMLDLALQADQSPVKLVHISDRQGLSLSYLEQLFARLRRQQLVTSFRGPGGGYRLARSADSINVAEIISAVNESMDTTNCAKQGNCQRGEMCLTHHLWMDLSAQLEQFLGGITLKDLVDKNRNANTANAGA